MRGGKAPSAIQQKSARYPFDELAVIERVAAKKFFGRHQAALIGVIAMAIISRIKTCSASGILLVYWYSYDFVAVTRNARNDRHLSRAAVPPTLLYHHQQAVNIVSDRRVGVHKNCIVRGSQSVNQSGCRNKRRGVSDSRAANEYAPQQRINQFGSSGSAPQRL